MNAIVACVAAMALALSASAPIHAGPLHDRSARGAARPERGAAQDDNEDLRGDPRTPVPPGVEARRNLAYGTDAKHRLDVYGPVQARGAPILMMVHGGGWRRGDKALRGVVRNKVARWVPRGFIVVSVNYRLSPNADPIEQARDIAKALSMVQAHASAWGGDATRIVLMGHSAGGHLVSLLASDPALVSGQGARPWLGTVVLDSAALDVVAIMRARHPRFYDTVFGAEPDRWRVASPWHRLTASPAPMLLVCSRERKGSCSHAERFAEKASVLGGSVTVLPVALSHRQVNQELGLAGAYTESVESFVRRLVTR